MSFRDSQRLETAIDSARDEAASPTISAITLTAASGKV